MCCSLKFVVCFLVCSAGLFWQVWNISVDYAKHETGTQIVVEIADEVQIPKLYIGFSEDDLLSANKAFNRTLYDMDENFYRYLYTTSANESTTVCRTQNPAKNILDKCPKIGKQFKAGRIYYYVAYNFSSLRSIELPSFLYFLAMSESITNSTFTFHLYMVPHNRNLHGDNYEGYSAASIVVNGTSKWTSYHLSYVYNKNILLPAPYDTGCFDYSTVGLESKEHCRYNCLEYNYNALFNKTFHGTLITAPHNEPPKNVLTGTVQCNLEDIAEVCAEKIKSKCHKTCHKNDCINEWFVPTVRTTASFPSKELQIMIWPSTTPSRIITYQAKTSILDLITYIFICISFWYGWCSLVILIGWKLKDIREKCRRNKVTPVDVENAMQVPSIDSIATNIRLDELNQQIQLINISLKKLKYLQVEEISTFQV